MGFGAGEGEFVLFHVDAGESGADDGGVAAFERGLKFGDGVVEFVAAAIDFGEAEMRGGVGRIGGERGAELRFGQFEPGAGEFLASLANVRRGVKTDRFAVGGNRRDRRGGRQNFEAKRGDVEIGFDAIEMRLRVALGVDLNRRQRVGSERFGDGVALFVGFGFFAGADRATESECAIFGVVGLALDGFAKRSGGGVEIVGAKREQALIEGIVVFVGIEFDGVFEVGLGILRFAFAREREPEIVENFGEVAAGDRSVRVRSFVAADRFLQRDENLLGFVGLIEAQTANADGEIGFDVVRMRLGHVAEPRERGIAVAATSVGFTERERRIGPSGIETRGFAQLADAKFVIIGEQAAHEMLEGIEAQGAHRFRKVGKAQRIGFVVGDQGVPDDFRLHVHQRGERAGFADWRDQGGRIDAEEMGIDGQSECRRN